MKKNVFFLFVSLFFGTQLFSQDPNFHIYLCFGQSNMEGQGTIEGTDRSVDSRFQQMYSQTCSGRTMGQWADAIPPLAGCGFGLGPADYFGRTMVANAPANVKIGVIVVAVAGCKIELFDKTGYRTYVNSVESWMQSRITAYGGNPYGRLVELAKLAQKDGVIKGILMHQGESNTGDGQWPTKVKGVYDNLINDLGLKASETPLLIGEVVGADQNGQCASHNSAIAGMPRVITNSHVISSASCQQGGDNLHFSSAGYRELGKRYAQKMLELITFETGVPSVSFTSPAANDVFEAPATISLKASASDEGGSISKVEFYNGNQKLGEASSSPYTYDWSDVAAGSYSISAVATDNDGKTSSASLTIKVNEPQGPYNGVAHAIPGKIEFEEYDAGGNGSAYYDASAGTNVDPAPNYRTDEDVDIEICSDTGGGYNLGWTEVDEWTEYTVNVASNGTYEMGLRVACEGTGKTITVESDGIVIAQDIAITNTGGWQEWQTITQDVELKAGKQVLRFTIGGSDYINMNYVEFTGGSIIEDLCPNDPDKTVPGACGCGTPDVDTDNDGTFDCEDLCVNDPNKIEPGECGCGVPEGQCNNQTGESNMDEGWNLIGYPYAGEEELESALSSIWDKVVEVKDFDGFYSKTINPNLVSLKVMKYGRGYFVKVSEPCNMQWSK